MRKYRDLNVTYGFGSPSLDCAICYTPSPVEPLLSVTLRDAVTDDDVPLVARVNDVYLLFNQQRLDLIGKDSVDAWIASLRSSTPVSNNLSDDDLINFVKSRHIQSMSELMSYSRWLTDNYADKLKEYLNSVNPDSAPDSDSASVSDSDSADK